MSSEVNAPVDAVHRDSLRAIRAIRRYIKQAHARVAEWDLPEYPARSAA